MVFQMSHCLQVSYLNVWYAYIFILFLQQAFGPGCRKGKPDVKETRWFPELFLQPCAALSRLHCAPENLTGQRDIMLHATREKSKSESTCLNHIVCLSSSWRHPAEPFCFPLFSLTLN